MKNISNMLVLTQSLKPRSQIMIPGYKEDEEAGHSITFNMLKERQDNEESPCFVLGPGYHT